MDRGRNLKVSVLMKAVAALLIVIAMPLEILLRDNLEYLGGKAITHLQDSWETNSATVFFRSVHYLGSEYLLIVGVSVLFHLDNPSSAIKIGVVGSTAQYVNSVISLIYCEPRPYWVYGHIKALDCLKGYGNPSPQIVVFAVASIYSINEYIKRKILRRLCFIGAFIALGLIGLSEIYLGDYFPHQIAVSYALSYIFIVVCIAFEESLHLLVYKSSFDYFRNRTSIVYWIIATIGMLSIVLLVYSVVTLQQNVEVIWIKHATDDCDFDYEVGNSYSFFYSAFIFYQLGLVLGAMFLHKFVSNLWWRTTFWKRYLRAGLAGGLVVALRFLFELIPSDEFAAEFTFQYCVPYFLMGIAPTLGLGMLSGVMRLSYRDQVALGLVNS